MNKPSPGPLSEYVRSCPDVSEMSPTGQDRTGQDITPQPPQAGGPRKLGGTSLSEVRADRARNGSRRKRDVEALAANSRVTVPADTQPSEAATQAWTAAMDRLTLRDLAKVAANAHWLECRGVSANRIVVTTEQLGNFWRRRNADLLSELVRQVSDFDGVLICDEVRS